MTQSTRWSRLFLSLFVCVWTMTSRTTSGLVPSRARILVRNHRNDVPKKSMGNKNDLLPTRRIRPKTRVQATPEVEPQDVTTATTTGFDSFANRPKRTPTSLRSGEASRPYRRTVYSHDDWKRHRSPDRFVFYLQAMLSFSSGVYKNIGIPVGTTTALAVLLLVYNGLVGGYTDLQGVFHQAAVWTSPVWPVLGIPLTPFTLASPSLGLLLVFRTNTSYQRWDEARKNWGMNINHTRDLMRMANAYYDNESSHGNPGNSQQRQQDLEHVAVCTWAFCRAMKRHLSPEEEDELAFQVELYRKLPSKQQAEAIFNAAHRPNRALQDLSYAIDALPMHFMRKHALQRALTILEDDLGSSERLLTSPVPLFYSRHTARFVALWTGLLPLALYEPMQDSWNHVALLPVTTLLSLFLFGLEELATQLEEPFTILPMQAFCDKIYTWCFEITTWAPGDNGMRVKPPKPQHAYFVQQVPEIATTVWPPVDDAQDETRDANTSVDAALEKEEEEEEGEDQEVDLQTNTEGEEALQEEADDIMVSTELQLSKEELVSTEVLTPAPSLDDGENDDQVVATMELDEEEPVEAVATWEIQGAEEGLVSDETATLMPDEDIEDDGTAVDASTMLQEPTFEEKVEYIDFIEPPLESSEAPFEPFVAEATSMPPSDDDIDDAVVDASTLLQESTFDEKVEYTDFIEPPQESSEGHSASLMTEDEVDDELDNSTATQATIPVEVSNEQQLDANSLPDMTILDKSKPSDSVPEESSPDVDYSTYDDKSLNESDVVPEGESGDTSLQEISMDEIEIDVLEDVVAEEGTLVEEAQEPQADWVEEAQEPHEDESFVGAERLAEEVIAEEALVEEAAGHEDTLEDDGVTEEASVASTAGVYTENMANADPSTLASRFPPPRFPGRVEPLKKADDVVTSTVSKDSEQLAPTPPSATSGNAVAEEGSSSDGDAEQGSSTPPFIGSDNAVDEEATFSDVDDPPTDTDVERPLTKPTPVFPNAADVKPTYYVAPAKGGDVVQSRNVF